MAWLDKLFGQLPKIIREAAASRLGIFALMIVAISLIVFAFFRIAEVEVRVAIFVLLFSGAGLFGYRVVRSEQRLSEPGAKQGSAATEKPSEELAKARAILASAEKASLSGRNDQARRLRRRPRPLQAGRGPPRRG